MFKILYESVFNHPSICIEQDSSYTRIVLKGDLGINNLVVQNNHLELINDLSGQDTREVKNFFLCGELINRDNNMYLCITNFKKIIHGINKVIKGVNDVSTKRR